MLILIYFANDDFDKHMSEIFEEDFYLRQFNEAKCNVKTFCHAWLCLHIFYNINLV